MFYEKIKHLCSLRGISITEFTKQIGASQSNVTSWKAGAQPRSKTVKSAADFFGVDISYFSEDDAPINPMHNNGFVINKEQEKKLAASDEPSIKIKNVKFIGRDGKVKYKNLSPEMIAMLEQLPDSDEDL